MLRALCLVLVLFGVTAGSALAQGGTPASPAPAPSPVPAPDPPSPADPDVPASPVKLHAFVSASYAYNLNRPPSGQNSYRVFDLAVDKFSLDVAELTLEKTVARPGDVGFRADLEAGESIPRISAASGLFRDPATGKAQDYDVKQVFASGVVPGIGLRIDAGKFVTPLGLEVIEGWDGYNDNASRSLLFGYAIPFTHTGVRASYAVGTKMSGLVMVAKGWDNVKDNNTGKTVALQLGFTPVTSLSVVLNAIDGPEQNNDNTHLRRVFDMVATWKLGTWATLGVNADDGIEAGAAPDGGRATWRGAAAYARLGFAKSFALCLRGEQFEDPTGARTGTVQRLTEFTATPTFQLSSHMTFRVDLRVDRSTGSVFETHTGSRKTQPTVQGNPLVSF